MRQKINPRWSAVPLAALLSLIAVWFLVPTVSTQKIDKNSEDQKAFENYDIRYDPKVKEGVVSGLRDQLTSLERDQIAKRDEELHEAEEKLGKRINNLRVTHNKERGAAEIVDVSKAGNFLTRSSSERPEKIVRKFMSTNHRLYGLDKEEVEQFKTRAVYTNPDGKITWVSLERTINGLPVFRGDVTAALTQRGELVRTVGEMTSGLRGGSLPSPSSPAIDARQAVAAAAESIGVTVYPDSLIVKEASPDGSKIVFEPGPFSNDIIVDLQYFPLEAGVASLSWGVQMWQDGPAYYAVVGSEKGDLFFRKNLVSEQTQAATYNVYDSDGPAPLSPLLNLLSPAIPTNQGTAIGRTSFTLISQHPLGDPWLNDGDNTTTGNNVDSGMDLVAPDGIDAGSRPVGAPLRVFNFAYNPGPGLPPPGDSPTGANYRFGEAVNMFYWTNRFHDITYALGFTEPARNFQQNNFGRGGLGNDRVLAQGQDFSGTNNANFLTPPDGTPGRMQMYVFTGPTPDRTSGLDQEILVHELTHGLSNRLHSNGLGLNFAQGGGMGEGWSDFYARAILSDAGEDINGLYAAGGYSTELIVAGYNTNYYYGIRRFPYALITTLGANGKPHNPLTFADVDAAQINVTDGAFPRGPIGSATAHQVHNVGEVWASTLMEVRARLIALHGFAAGNQRALQLVTDGMKLEPADPTMLQARDAILAASAASGGGAAEEAAIWAGFAARGMGFLATVSAANSAPIVVGQNFETPNLLITNVAVVAEDCGEDNNAPDPGETVTLGITLTNPLAVAASNVSVSIVGGGSAFSFRPIPGGSNATYTYNLQYTVPAGVQCGDIITLTVNINSSLGPVTKTIQLQIGVPTSLGGTVNNSSGNVAVPINDNTTVDIPINVPQAGRVGRVKARVRLNHSFDGDLVLSLVSPDGTVVPLANNRGGAGDNYGSGANDCSGTLTVFDPSAAVAIGAGAAPFVGSFRPDGNFSAFAGKQMNGVWKLRVADTANLDTGTIGCAQVEITEQLFFCCGVPGVPVINSVPPPVLIQESQRRGNGFVDPGERVLMNFAMKNVGSDVTEDLYATLLPGGGVSLPSGPKQYGAISPVGPPVAEAFEFNVSGACGSTVTATFNLTDPGIGAPSLGTVSFPIILGTPVGGLENRANAGSITIPGTGTGAASGAPANPYPSAINVAGVTGTVQNVRVTLNGFSHTFPGDVDVLLVGPGGQTALLVSDVGGGTDISNVVLSLDDTAAAQIGATIVSGIFRPTNSGTGDLFPAPAPAGPYANSALSVFSNLNPNGTWSLYVVDDAGIDSGSISGGWSLSFTTLDYVCP